MGGLSGLQNKISGRQLSAWLLVATVGPLLSVVGRNGWVTVLLGVVLCGTLTFCVLTCKTVVWPRWLCILEAVWLVVFLGGLAKSSGSCWETKQREFAIPAILLLLAALASARGAFCAARTGASLLWLALPVLGVVALAGTSDAHLQWVRQGLDVPDGTLISLLLVPSLAIFLPRETSDKTRWTALLLGMIAVAASVLMDAAMGSAVAIHAENSFYEFSKGISLLGVAERFEGIVACVLTLGWFALFAFILSAIHYLLKQVFSEIKSWSVWITVLIALVVMCILPEKDYWMAMGTLIFWGFLPVAAQGIVGAKNVEKK